MSGLKEQRVLILDLQSTGAGPEHGNILEVAYCTADAADSAELELEPERIRSSLVRLPEGETVPRRISALTGITDDDLKAAEEPQKVWQALNRAAGDSAKRKSPAPTVVHYARFEERFLRALHEQCAPDTVFPLDFICTHEIARRLFPDVPRRGLKALTGYLGIPTPELKRAGAHVTATAAVWAELVGILRTKHNVKTLSDLRRWLDTTTPTRSRDWVYPLPREKRLALPDDPGVYRFLSRQGDILYVGKATSLKIRVNSYYRKKKGFEEAKLEMLSRVWDLNITVTPTPLEAALLENDEIKLHNPPYNRALRPSDGKVWFASRDASSVRPEPDDQHPLGPIPRKETITGFDRLCALLKKEHDPPDAEETADFVAAAGLPETFCPEPEILKQALESFNKRHLTPRPKGKTVNALLRLGMELWRTLAAERSADAAEEELEDEEEPEELEEQEEEQEEMTLEERLQDPERWANIFEGFTMNAARLLRRAHWLCRLSESRVAWTPKTGSKKRRRLLTIHKGEVTDSSELGKRKSIQPPPGWNRGRLERQQSFDRTVYDRMRVLTTELRRILAEGGKVEIVFSPRRTAGPEKLSSLLMLV